jgi:hypothetical protein
MTSYQSIEREIEENLIWLWHCDPLQLKSNFPDQLNVKCQIQLDTAHNFAILHLYSIHRKKQLEKAFFQLPILNQRVLYAQNGWLWDRNLSPETKHLYVKKYQKYAPIIIHFHQVQIKSKKEEYLIEAKILYKQSILLFNQHWNNYS